MRHWWWKILGVALVLGAVITALRVPLAPGLVHIDTTRLEPGPRTITVTGYRTSFSHGPVTAWLENGGQFICAEKVVAIDDTRSTVQFMVPAGMRESMSDLLVDDPIDGTLRYYDAFYNPEKGTGLDQGTCTPTTARSSAGHFAFPNRSLLYETIRNLNLHVPMWFTMMLLQTIALVYSIKVLRRGDLDHDRAAVQAVNVSLLFAFLGLVTGSIWARATWGGWWTSDTKLNGAAVTVLIYLAYLVLRGSVPEPNKRARLAAIYNVFAFVLMLVFVMVLPRLNDSLHPGNGGNPAFSQYDLDDRLRLVFYPAVLGWMLVGTWAFTLKLRLSRVEHALDVANDR